MAEDYNVRLNFLPAEGPMPDVTVYRRPMQSPQERRPPLPNVSLHKLPVSLTGGDEWQAYWVVDQPADGFEPFPFRATLNADLSRRVLFSALSRSVTTKRKTNEYHMAHDRFIQEVRLVMRRHPEGEELLVVQPYSLRVTQQTGFLVDFHFELAQTAQFDRRVLQLSLSLDKSFRRNLDHYVDRMTKIRTFLSEARDIFDDVQLPGTPAPLGISREFVALPAQRLRTKVYVFANGRESRSQFMGLREYGPLCGVRGHVKLLFIFREQDRQAARLLAVSLKGTKQRGQFNFPGFKALFKTEIEIDGNPIILRNLDNRSMAEALNDAKARTEDAATLLPVLVLPKTDDNGYFAQKAYFTRAGLPTQVCTLKILEDEDSLKWAIGNLALQIFCKAGGQPWKVRPAAEKSLIVGISQSHKLERTDNGTKVEKYFAFSILTDSSGLFQQIRILGEDKERHSYLSALRANLASVLKEHAESFHRVVIHTSFRLKHEEIETIRRAAGDAAAATDPTNCRFAVIKVNQRNRFFGINPSVNSLVPYEATRTRLGPHEYLVWFEGIYPDRPNVTKVFSGPTHLQFLSVGDERPDQAEERELIQDLVNLSGANWRGFNAKSAPVSVFYCHLVADFVRDFHERGLPMPAVVDIRPWFL